MKPKGYMLKFRAPFYEQSNMESTSLKTIVIEYSDIFVGTYIYKHLVVAKVASPDYKQYEDKFFLYNTIESVFVHRRNKLANPLLSFDHCNDCATEASIWESYCKNVRSINVFQCINTLNIITNRPLGINAHGGFFSLLLSLLKVSIINLRHDSVNKYADLPNKLAIAFYKCRYPLIIGFKCKNI